MRKSALLFLFVFAATIYGQVTNPTIIPVSSLPPSCTTGNLPMWILMSSGAIYSCQGGVPAAVGGGGGTWPGYPGVGIVVSTGAAWDASLSETDGNILYGASGSWTKGTALPNGITAATQSQADGSTKVATTAYVDTGLATKGAGTVTAVSVATANGVSGSSSGGATPALTIALGAITPTSTNGVSSTTMGYVDPTSSVQTQLNGKVATTTTVNGHALSSNVTVTASDVSLGNVTNDAQTKASVVPNTAPSGGQLLVGNVGGTAYAALSLSGDATLASTGAMTLATKYKTWTCQPGFGDGLNAMAAGTYLQSECWNTTGVTITLTGVSCYTDNSGSSTLNASGNTLGSLLTGAVTCTSSLAAGSQSANVALTNNDYIKFTFVADGTSKQTTAVVTGTY